MESGLDPALERASWRDFFPIRKLERMCFGRDAWPSLDVLAALSYPSTVRFKALVEGEIVGFVIADPQPRRSLGWIASICVHPEYRRRGIGGALLCRAERALQMPRVRLLVRRSNQAARALYAQAGYRQIERRGSYYRDGEDAVVMERQVIKGG